MFDTRAGKPPPRLLIERQPLRFRAIGQRLPFFFQGQDEAEVTGIDALLRKDRFGREMGDQLVPGDPNVMAVEDSRPNTQPRPST